LDAWGVVTVPEVSATGQTSSQITNSIIQLLEYLLPPRLRDHWVKPDVHCHAVLLACGAVVSKKESLTSLHDLIV
jgi:hypothetical protein